MTASSSAPEKPGVPRAMTERSTAGASFTFRAWTLRIASRPFTSGRSIVDGAVEAARAQERRVEDVGPVGRRHDDDPLVRVEAVHLDEDLVERLLALVVAAAEARAAPAPDRVDLVEEDDARRVLLRLLEEVADARGAHADEHLHEVASREIEKKGTSASPAIALASSVLPQPGGPTSSTPRGMRPPSRWNFCGFLRNSTISRTSSLASSMPATSSNVTFAISGVYMRARLRPKESTPPAPPACRIGRKMKNQKKPAIRSQGAIVKRNVGRSCEDWLSLTLSGEGNQLRISLYASRSSTVPRRTPVTR